MPQRPDRHSRRTGAHTALTAAALGYQGIQDGICPCFSEPFLIFVENRLHKILRQAALADDKIYTFCGVVFPYAPHPYHYRTDDPTIKVGDEVLVPVGDKETTGKVVSVGQYMRVAAPFPVDRTKFIIRKMDEKLE